MRHLNEQQANLVSEVRNFIEKSILPNVASADLEKTHMREWFLACGMHGFLGIAFPKEYGGRGMSALEFILALEEISKCSASLGASIAAHVHCAKTILDYGTDEQKSRILPSALNGTLLMGFAMSEEQDGSDALNIMTFADPKEDSFIVNGSKHWITNGGAADLYLITAMSGSLKRRRDLRILIADSHLQGLTTTPIKNRLGLNNAAISDLTLHDCIISKENLLGSAKNGYDITITSLVDSRLYLSAVATGVASGALDCALQYIRGRKPFGRSITAYQGVTFPLSEMYTELLAARSMLYVFASGIEDGSTKKHEISSLKLFTTSTCVKICDKALLLMGGNGYCKQYQIERFMRDSKMLMLAGGTSEICKMIISNSLI